uniref:Uncharacterized protein n=1 Tax=Caudovirales sp. ctNZz8 TaxID=2826772 RepID=A0A8S5QZY8_9CAUD|nr:MAG TPA: hypothetical protein [Caudovirales sp. ctNZz8]
MHIGICAHGTSFFLGGAELSGVDSDLVRHVVSPFINRKRRPERMIPLWASWCSLLAECFTHVSEIINAVDLVDVVQRVDLADLLAVDVGLPITDGVLAAAVRGGGGSDLARLIRLGNDDKNVLDIIHGQLTLHGVFVLLRHAQVDVMAARLAQADGLLCYRAEVERQRHRVDVSEDRSLDIAGNTGTGNGLRQRSQVGQRHRRKATVFVAILVDSEIDYSLIHRLISPFSALQRSRNIVGIVLQDEIDLLCGRGRRHVDMQLNDAGHQVGYGVFTFQQLHTRSQQIALTDQTVEPNVGTVKDAVDQTAVHRLVQLRPEGLNQGIANPAEHTADGDKVILDIGAGRVAAGVVAPQNMTTHEVDAGHDACGIQRVRLRQRHADLRPVRQTQAVDGQALIAGALVGDAAVAHIGRGDASDRQRGSVEHEVAQLAVGPANDMRVGVCAAVLRGDGRGIAACADVHDRLCLEHTVDAFGLDRHSSGHGGLVGEAGRADQIRHDTERSHAQLDVLQSGDDGGSVDAGRGDLLVRDVHLGRAISRTAAEQLDDHAFINIVNSVIRSLGVGCAGTAGSLHDEARIVDSVDAQLHLMIDHIDISGSDRLRHLCGIKQVAADDRLAAEHFEMSVHHFADAVFTPVVGVTQLLHRFGPARAEHGNAGASGIVGTLHGGSADHERNAAFRDIGGADRRCRLPDKYAMVGHNCTSLFLLHGSVRTVQRAALGFDLSLALGQGIARNDQVGDGRAFLDCHCDLRQRKNFLFAAAVHRPILDRADHSRADIAIAARLFLLRLFPAGAINFGITHVRNRPPFEQV